MDFDAVVLHATLCIARGKSYEDYCSHMVGLVDVFFTRTNDPAQILRNTGMAGMLARQIWKRCPHPAHAFAPAPLPPLERNSPCPCGSGRKYKHCCQPFEASFPELQVNWLIPLLEHIPKLRWSELAASRVSLEMVVDLAVNWQQARRDKDVLALLEPWFSGDRHWSARYEALFDLLLDAYTTLHKPRRKKELLERALMHGDATMVAGAQQRMASIAADEGDFARAWALFAKAQRSQPGSPNLAHLEVTMLLAEMREDDARDRARFWLAKFSRLNDPDLGELCTFLRQAAEHGGDVFIDVATQDNPALRRFIECWRRAPAPELLYSLEPADGSAGPLSPKPHLLRALDAWARSLSMAQRMSQRGFALFWWEGAAQWIDVLDAHPQLWSAFEVLDALVQALYEVPVTDVGRRLALPLLDRGEVLLRDLLRSHDADGLRLEWGWRENRAALSLFGERIAMDLAAEPTEAHIARMEWIVLQLNPDDNQGFRTSLLRRYLEVGRVDDALRLTERYNDDLASMRYGRALALFASERPVMAVQALREAVQAYPKPLRFLLAANPRKPRSGEWGVVVGSDDEAWRYRESHIGLWRKLGAIDWARDVSKALRLR